MRRYITTRLADLRELLYSDVERARCELGKHLTEIRMLPQSSGKDAHYVATGSWDLLGGYAEGREYGKRVGVVAGDRNVPSALVRPFRLNLFGKSGLAG